MDIGEMILNFVTEVEEKKDDFIFTTIKKWGEEVTDIDKIVISKQILIRALTCFKKEHEKEYYDLLDDSLMRFKYLYGENIKYGKEKHD